jgi:hypothetical protein
LDGATGGVQEQQYMCQRAGVAEPLLPVSLALAAFEETPLEEAASFVRANRSNLEDLAWAFSHSGSPEEFEEKLRQRVAEMERQPGRSSSGAGGSG